MNTSHGGTLYGVTYTGHGRVPNASVTYTWGPGTSPMPKKDQVIDVTLWQGTPVYLSFGTTTVTVNTPPDKDAALVAAFADIAALGAVFAALIGRPVPHTRKALAALRVIDWAWLPGLIAGFVFVVVRFYGLGFAVIDASGGLAFLVSEALRVRLLVSRSRGGVSVGDDPHSPPPPGLRAEREHRKHESHDCPVGPEDQRWIESELSTLRSRFHIDARTHPILRPTRNFYPVSYDGEALEIHELTRKLCGTMGVDLESVFVRLVGESGLRTSTARARNAPYPGHFSADTYDPETQLYVIDLDDWLAEEPVALSAVIAHELAHLRLYASPSDRVEGKPDGLEGKRREQQADLLALAYGLGLFGANVPVRSQHRLSGTGTLNSDRMDHAMYGYALACLAWLREDREPQWAKSLEPLPRGYLDQGLRFLEQEAGGGGGLPTLSESRAR
jgi:hypothetical protein